MYVYIYIHTLLYIHNISIIGPPSSNILGCPPKPLMFCSCGAASRYSLSEAQCFNSVLLQRTNIWMNSANGKFKIQ